MLVFYVQRTETVVLMNYFEFMFMYGKTHLKGRARRKWVKKSKVRKVLENVPQGLYYDTANAYVRSSVPSFRFFSPFPTPTPVRKPRL